MREKYANEQNRTVSSQGPTPSLIPLDRKC